MADEKRQKYVDHISRWASPVLWVVLGIGGFCLSLLLGAGFGYTRSPEPLAIGRPWLAIGAGVVVGLVFNGTWAIIFRKTRSFYATFYTLRIRQRLRWPVLWRNALRCLPVMYASWASIIALAMVFKFSLPFALGGLYLTYVLLYWEQKKIYEAAKAKLAAIKEGTA